MSLPGEYVPSPRQWVRDQVDAYENSAGAQANTLRRYRVTRDRRDNAGKTKHGTVRKIALMRVEHDGEYAPGGIDGRRAQEPRLVLPTSRPIRMRSPSRTEQRRSRPRYAKSAATSACAGGSGPSRRTRRTPSTSNAPNDRSRSSSPAARARGDHHARSRHLPVVDPSGLPAEPHLVLMLRYCRLRLKANAGLPRSRRWV